MHSNHTTQSTSETAEVTNGTGSIVLSSTYGSFSADVQTVDEVLDDSDVKLNQYQVQIQCQMEQTHLSSPSMENRL